MQKTKGLPPPKGPRENTDINELQLKPRNPSVQSGTTKADNYGPQGNPYHCFPQGLMDICLCCISIVYIVTKVASFWRDLVNEWVWHVNEDMLELKQTSRKNRKL